MDMADSEMKSNARKLSQRELDKLAETLDIQYAVLDNLTGGHATYTATLTLSNKGIYF